MSRQPLIGRPLPRREDERLTTGAGRYTSDIAPSDAVHAAFVRTAYAHARILAIRTDVAMASPGVLAVLTAADYAADGHGPIRHLPNPADAIDPSRPAFVSGPGEREVVETPQPPLAIDVVRYAGEAVVMVVAETAGAARDAADLVEVDYDPLPLVVRSVDAVEPGAVQLWPDATENCSFDLHHGDASAVEQAFAKADVILEHEFTNQRVIAAHMEPRAAFASYDPATETYTVTAGSQGVVRHRAATAGALNVPLPNVRYCTPDVGGGFGARNNVHAEPVLLAWAARRVGKTVAWTSTRSEGFTTDYHGRDIVVRVQMALTADGHILGMRYDNLCNVGAYTVSFASMQNVVRIATGPYHVPAAEVRVRAVFTNTTPTAPYRGAGRPEIVFAFERLLDLAATRLDIDRVTIRRQNLITRSQFPYQSPLGLVYDSGDFVGNMERVVALAGWDGFAERRARAARAGKLRGIGVANYLESPVGAPRERVTVTVTPTTVEIISGTQSNGQGHETTFAQVTADLLDVPYESVVLRTGDTEFVTAGGGTHSNRSMRLVSTLLFEICEDLNAQAKAASKTIFELAADFAARGASLTVTADIARRIPAFPTGAAVCELEVDPNSGSVEIIKYTSVDDAGRVINPLIVDGQTHGGIAQGIGQALYEAIDYDPESGQPNGGTFMSYAMPRAYHVPMYDLELVEDRTAGNPLSIKGGGEAGVTPSPAVIINAICQALEAYGVTDVPMPATPETLWRLMQSKETLSATSRDLPDRNDLRLAEPTGVAAR